MGRVSKVSNPEYSPSPGAFTITTYDALSRVASVIRPDNYTVYHEWTGSAVKIRDTAGTVNQQTKDALGRLVQVVENFGGSPQYTTTYLNDALDNLTAVCQGGAFDSAGNCQGGYSDEPGVGLDPVQLRCGGQPFQSHRQSGVENHLHL